MARLGAGLSLLLPVLLAGHSSAAVEKVETRLSLDVKAAPVQDIVGLLAELGGFQVVFDRGIDCALTLKFHERPWLAALDTALRACGLGREESGGVLWVASTTRLGGEADARRRLEEKRGRPEEGRLVLFRLSYARAEEMAPLLGRLLSPRGDVTADARTNTLIIRY